MVQGPQVSPTPSGMQPRQARSVSWQPAHMAWQQASATSSSRAFSDALSKPLLVKPEDRATFCMQKCLWLDAWHDTAALALHPQDKPCISTSIYRNPTGKPNVAGTTDTTDTKATRNNCSALLESSVQHEETRLQEGLVPRLRKVTNSSDAAAHNRANSKQLHNGSCGPAGRHNTAKPRIPAGRFACRFRSRTTQFLLKCTLVGSNLKQLPVVLWLDRRGLPLAFKKIFPTATKLHENQGEIICFETVTAQLVTFLWLAGCGVLAASPADPRRRSICSVLIQNCSRSW